MAALFFQIPLCAFHSLSSTSHTYIEEEVIAETHALVFHYLVFIYSCFAAFFHAATAFYSLLLFIFVVATTRSYKYVYAVVCVRVVKLWKIYNSLFCSVLRICCLLLHATVANVICTHAHTATLM